MLDERRIREAHAGGDQGLELAKLARRDRQHFDCATWLHRAPEMPMEQFKQEVREGTNGKETEPRLSKLSQSKMPIIGKRPTRGYCLEMIRSDFLAGANLGPRRPRYGGVLDDEVPCKFLPEEQRQAFLEGLREKV